MKACITSVLWWFMALFMVLGFGGMLNVAVNMVWARLLGGATQTLTESIAISSTLLFTQYLHRYRGT